MQRSLCCRLAASVGVGVLLLATAAGAFTTPTSSVTCHRLKQICYQRNLHLFQSTENEEKKVAVGSSEYYQGFMNRLLNEEPVERVTGDAILGPTFKFIGGISVILVLLTLGFLASNGLI